MALLIPALLILLAAPAGTAEPVDAAPVLALAPGDYVVVGREPGGGAAYSGQARIEAEGRSLKLLRRLADGSTATLVGALETALGGEARVLRFRGPAASPRTMTCLERVDLDNELRLTCQWTYDADPAPREPGLEVLFPTGAWPDDAPHKHFGRQ